MTNLESAIGKATDIKYWSAPPIWKGKTVVVIGGGPSLLKFPVERLSALNCIAINNAFSIAPWAKFLVYHDSRWLKWHLTEVARFAGTIVTTHTKSPPVLAKRMRKDRKIAINLEEADCLAGVDSGTMGLNLAYHLGASVIALVGFDMGFTKVRPLEPPPYGLDADQVVQLQTPIKVEGFETPATRAMDPKVLKHWHQEHPVPPKAVNYDRFLKQYPDIIKALRLRGVRLVSLTTTRIPIPKVKIAAISNPR